MCDLGFRLDSANTSCVAVALWVEDMQLCLNGSCLSYTQPISAPGVTDLWPCTGMETDGKRYPGVSVPDGNTLMCILLKYVAASVPQLGESLTGSSAWLLSMAPLNQRYSWQATKPANPVPFIPQAAQTAEGSPQLYVCRASITRSISSTTTDSIVVPGYTFDGALGGACFTMGQSQQNVPVGLSSTTNVEWLASSVALIDAVVVA